MTCGREHSLPDPATALNLDADTYAAWVVSPDGARWPWLIRSDGNGQPGGCRCRDCAPHDQLGRLPDAFHPLRCRRPRADGRPCRRAVAQPGAACHYHRARKETR